jgi:two-component SAPR family response regulator
MAVQRILLFGQNALLLGLLRKTAGHSYQVETYSGSFSQISDSEMDDVGMIVVLHHPPVEDGTSTVRNIKRSQPLMPIVAITSEFSGQATRLLMKSGAEDVLSLGADAQEIKACYEAYLPGYGLVAAKKTRKTTTASAVGRTLITATTPGMILMGAGVQKNATLPIQYQEKQAIVQNTESVYKGLEISFFGAFKAKLYGKSFILTKQSKLLFAYLAYNHPKALSKDHLAKVIWPEKYEYKPESAIQSLNVEITRIRKSVIEQTGYERKLIAFDKNFYRLDLPTPILSDVVSFKSLYQDISITHRNGQSSTYDWMAEAIKIYAGNFLEDFPADAYNWVEVERQHLSSVFEQIADLRSAQLYDEGKFWEAGSVCREILERDPRMEAIHRRAMRCFARLGMMNQVEMQYAVCARMMEAEFQSKPSAETELLLEEIRKGKL